MHCLRAKPTSVSSWLVSVIKVFICFSSMGQDRTPGESFVAKSAKEAEMEKIMKSMEVITLSFRIALC